MKATERGEMIVSAVLALGHQGRVWVGGDKVRVYVKRRLSGGTQDIGYIQVLPDGTQDYSELTRNKAGIRDAVETYILQHTKVP